MLAQSCTAVSKRALQTLAVARSNGWVLDSALDSLTLCRSGLSRVLLSSTETPPKIQESSLTTLDVLLDGLRRAGGQDQIPRGLLTRAWLRFLTGACTGPESAQEDLDEAWEIAERGPMRLHMADIHLYRARLFHAVKPYPWNKNPDGTERGPQEDLAAARKLIEQCGYWRRKEELEDAEEAAKYW